MKKTIMTLGLMVTCALSSYSQQSETRSSSQGHSGGSVSQGKARLIDIELGTRLEAQLQNSLDVRKAKVGDQVVLKTTQALKNNGRTVVDKGTRLIGRVTEIEQQTEASGSSRIGLVFDRLEKGSLEFPISATITSITRGSGSARASDDDLFTTAGARSSTSVRSNTTGQSRGGLLGGVANTAGGAINTTTTVAGNVADGATGAVGATVDSRASAAGGAASGPGLSIGRIQISESSSSAIEGGVVLSLEGENLRLDKGTRFALVINQSAGAGDTRQQ